MFVEGDDVACDVGEGAVDEAVARGDEGVEADVAEGEEVSVVEVVGVGVVEVEEGVREVAKLDILQETISWPTSELFQRSFT